MAGMVDQAVLDSVEGEFGTVGDAELIEDIMQMIFGGLLGDSPLLRKPWVTSWTIPFSRSLSRVNMGLDLIVAGVASLA